MLNRKMFLACLLCYSATAISLDFYVSPSGNDLANGRAADNVGPNGPFLTIARAQQAIRDLKKNGAFQEAVTIHLQHGEYKLASPLHFDVRDSGAPDRPIRWQAENGVAVISGGIALKNCQQGDHKFWACPTADLQLENIKNPASPRKLGHVPSFELFVDGQALHLARWPDNDWAHIKSPLDERTRFNSFEQLPAIPGDIDTIQVHIFAGNDWFDQFIALSAIDPQTNEISLASKTGYPLASGRRFYLENIRSELNAPGEWYFDQSENQILFVPPLNVSPETIVVSSQKNLLAIDGANRLSFQNISFVHSTDVAIAVNKASDLVFDHIEVGNVGGRGIEVTDSRNVKIANSQIHHTGNGGVQLAGGDRTTLQAANNALHNSHIHHFGRIVMTNTPGIEVAGVGSQITHNLVEASPGPAIFIGGNEHLLEKNEVHHVCEQASDCGAIYAGRDWTLLGNIIRYNSVHDISGYGLKSVDIAKNSVVYGEQDGGRGIYLDDGVGGFTVFGNLLVDAGQMAIQLGGGRFHTIENNLVIARHGFALMVDNRWPDYKWSENQKRLTQVPYLGNVWRSKYPMLAEPMNNPTWPENNAIKKNIFIADMPAGKLLRYQMPAGTNTISENLVWASGGTVSVDYDILDRLKKRSGASWQEWAAEGVEKGGMFANPCVTVSGNRVSFCPDSPVSKIGFQSIPTDIGLLK